MNELTLESLAKRVEALERALEGKAMLARSKDWRRVVGMFKDSEFMRQVDEEGRQIREAERAEAQQAKSHGGWEKPDPLDDLRQPEDAAN